MSASFLRLATEQSLGLVAAALLICLVGSWLLVGLLRRSARTRGTDRYWWLSATAVVAGVTVWTTHFLAMLGYRVDLAMNYDLDWTLLSIGISVLTVGVPLAATVFFPRQPIRITLGAIAGLGIGAMHFTGMAAIVGCLQTQSLPAAVLACLAGAACYGTAMAITGRFHTRVVKTLLFTTGVCATHFIAISGVSLTQVPGFQTLEHLNPILGALTGGASLTLFAGAMISLIASKRLRIQERAHTTILATALDNMSNGLLFIGEDHRLRLFNDRFLKMFDISKGVVHRGMTVSELISVLAKSSSWDGQERQRITRRVQSVMKLAQSETFEHSFADGRLLEVVSGPVQGGVVITFDDKTAERQAQLRIEHMAYHDPLTALANRRALQERMEEGFAPKRRYKLLLVDLDRFKAVNDTFGHSVGDELLVAVAERIRDVTGGDDFVARYGGDELAVLVYGDLDLSMSVANNIVDAMSRPFLIQDFTLSIGCSIGMCCTDDAQDVTELMQRADLALYEAKHAGRGQASCYQSGMLEQIAARHQLEQDIKAAIEQRQFHLAYQPILSLHDDRIVGYEALIRWEHPTRGRVSPAEFIPFAEETGQIVAIGQWVLEEACREAACWADDQHVAVNISPVQFKSPSLRAHIVSALDRSGLPPHRLEIELTETALVADGQALAHILGEIRALGIKVAMDDFGTGYSSFAHLRDFPIDRIKIDRSFVASAVTDSHAMAVLRAITQLGQDMCVPTLAEGVETLEQLELVRGLGCDDVQGYLIGKPERLDTSSIPQKKCA
ncbi:EAL domain-containing protein [Tianweitania sp.]|uniref:bifunctional diguanylate cyclase/phosphodiesterase n=1 Tax=Tianweitania sp. TaxID=2021634 RepID=UPI0028A18F0A|nr:EAL domain-containing protein [Tianweitania sp.]